MERVLQCDIRTGKTKIVEREPIVPIPKAIETISIDLKELAQVIEDVKRIKEKLGMT